MDFTSKTEQELLILNQLLDMKLSNRINELCSISCNLSDFEEYELFTEEKLKKYINYRERYQCYSRCISKNYQSFNVALSTLNNFYLSQELKKNNTV
jgi:hypothetical protein